MTVPFTGWRAYSNTNPIPLTQNTAPVLEFRCLYTADLRRKQKRWQDGRLKFHTFNKRVMVYDDQSNFVGDSHWREIHAFGEGEELELERCAILVEVSECVGVTEQDLAPLFNKVVKDGEERAHLRGATFSLSRPPGPSIRTQPTGLLDTVRTDLSLSKRRKLNGFGPNTNGYAQNLTGANLALSRNPSSTVPPHAKPTLSRTMKQPTEEIDLLDDAALNPFQEGLVDIGIRQTQQGDTSQANRLSDMSLPGCSNSSYAQNITGAALVLGTKVTAKRRPPLALGMKTNATTGPGETLQLVTTTENHEFIDIDVYDRKDIQAETTRKLSSQTNNFAESRQKLSPESSAYQTYSDRDQVERSFRPLRIRTRPKRKLLSTTGPSARHFPLTEASVENSNRPVHPPIAPKDRREAQPLLKPVVKIVSVSERGTRGMGQACAPLPIVASMDHHGIDVFLTQQIRVQTGNFEEKHAKEINSDKSISLIQTAKEWVDHTGMEDQEGALCDPTLQLVVQQNIIGSPRQRLITRDDRHTEISEVCSGLSRKSRSSPQLTNSYSQAIENNAPRNQTIMTPAENVMNPKPVHQVGGALAVNRDIVPFKPPAKLIYLKTKSAKSSVSDNNKQDEPDRNVMPRATTRSKPASLFSKAKIGEGVIAVGNKGPWTREAFDLFGWKTSVVLLPGDQMATG